MAARGTAAGAPLLLGILATPCAFGLNPALDISQYAHTAWKSRDGFTRGQIVAIAQTSDGYLWLGTAFGLFRFDGIKAVPWLPPKGQPLPSSDIESLAVARDGTLWIGTENGLASWKDGRLTPYPEMAGLAVGGLIDDPAGLIWVGARGVGEGKFCEIRQGDIRCHPEMSHLGNGVSSLYEDDKGKLWVGLETGVWQWKPGPPKFYPITVPPFGITGMADGDDGGLLISMTGSVGRLVDGKAQIAHPFPTAMRRERASRILRDRDGGLWVATGSGGLLHLHQGRTDVLSQTDGLTGDSVVDIFEDREGNIWVGTTNGFDRFRELPVVTYSTKQDLPNALVSAVLAARDGSIWFDTADGLTHLNRGQLTVYRPRHDPVKAGVREIVIGGLPERAEAALFEDSSGRVWISSVTGVGYLENDKFITTALPGGYIGTISEDSSGNIWITNQNLGLFKWSLGGQIEQIPWTTFGSKDPGPALVPDPVRGGVWLGFFRGGVTYFRDGQVRASYSAASGLGAGRVNSLRWDGKGALWAATDGGLSRLKDGRIVTLSSNNGLPCDAVHWVIEDDAGSIWLGMPCGLVRVARADFDRWAADGDKAGGMIHATVFDTADGVHNRAIAGGQAPIVAKSSDGKLWFPGLEGISVVDPRHLPFNKLPPPVQINQIIADRKTYAADTKLRLPPLIRDVQIDYTALSLVAPEKMRFRYKLEGRDRDWIEVGTRRQAFYSDLPPRNYRFRVAASNNSGVWNEAGAFLDFGVAPAYYQTRWFQASCAATVLLLLAALYQLRLYQLKRQLQVRMEERVNERTRLARDLHDTLLQSFQGVLLKFQAVTYLFPDRVEEAPKTLAAVIEEARAAITEGRDAVYGLRASTLITNDLAKALHTLGEELAADRQGQPCPEYRVQVEGESRDLLPLVRDEVYRIGGEAVRNAFRHAQATRVEVDIHYDRRVLRLRVRDDGKGLDPKILSEGGRAGHFGLPGMHERAKLVGGQLAVWSEAGSGTEVELTIPASVAYSKPPERRTLFARRNVG
jgi:signal transduction histidine kinase/ligand-binding sensor domain-containing protein